MSPRHIVSPHPPHMDQFLPNEQSGDDAHVRSTIGGARRYAQSRITALLGTRHSKHSDLGRLLQDTWQKRRNRAKVNRSTPPFGANVQDRSADMLIPSNAECRRRIGELLALFSKSDTHDSESKQERFARLVKRVTTLLSNYPPFDVPTEREVMHLINKEIDERTITASGASVHDFSPELDRWPRPTTHPLVMLAEAVDGIIDYGTPLLSRQAGSVPTRAVTDSIRVPDDQSDPQRPPWLYAIDEHISDIIVVDRGALNDRKTFWSTMIEQLSSDMTFFEQMENFVWRSWRVLLETVINLLARIRVFAVSDGDEGDSHIVRRFLRNLARKHHRRNRHVANGPGGKPNGYTMIWVNRESGWDGRAAVESPIFNALVTQLSQEGYLRNIQYDAGFHLVIAGRGDTRYVLDQLGVEPSGHHFRNHFMDLGGLSRGQTQDTLSNYLQIIAKHHLPRKCALETQALCLEELPSLSGFHLETLSSLCAQHPKRALDVDFGLLKSNFYRCALRNNPELAAVRQAFITSVEAFSTTHVKPQSLTTAQAEVPNTVAFCLDEWRYLQTFDRLLDVIQHVLQHSTKHLCKMECKQVLDKYRKRHLIDSDHNGVEFGLETWDFGRLLCQQLDPILEQDANAALSELERAGCMDVAQYVAEAFEQKEKTIAIEALMHPNSRTRRDAALHSLNRERERQDGVTDDEKAVARESAALKAKKDTFGKDNAITTQTPYAPTDWVNLNLQLLTRRREQLDHQHRTRDSALPSGGPIANAAVTLTEFELRIVVEDALGITTLPVSTVDHGHASTKTLTSTADDSLDPKADSTPKQSAVHQVDNVDLAIAKLLAADMLEVVHFRSRLDGEEDEITNTVQHTSRSYRMATPRLRDKLLISGTDPFNPTFRRCGLRNTERATGVADCRPSRRSNPVVVYRHISYISYR